MLREQNAPLISNPYAKSMNEDISEETKAALIEKGYEYFRPKHKALPRFRLGASVPEVNAYYETQADWLVSPDGEIVHWYEVEL